MANEQSTAAQSSPQKPTVGRIVHYRLSAIDAENINRRRTSGASIAERLKSEPPTWPAGAQAHIGNGATAGEVFPLVVVRVHDEPHLTVNGQVLLDGNDQLWVTSAGEGTENGTWSWPPRA